MSQLISELNMGSLSVSQKMDVIELLWNSLPEPGQGLSIPAWHVEELERRVVAADATPDKAIPWEKVKARIRQKA